ncbi:DNA -binding domain-containing protein [Tanticharoenia sakaeratensis]|uniref:T6SS Transcription factor RovC-like DNA binding domain-containing protein n=1 Tax=Tanticharoenia sakaeratensis NBRC 103193 TaxID=1231623 RepID=A0A0D6MNP2_9PROT|nr:DUF2285 domain-containing protein [Tanticharoenia sakaeratensis]GAN55302.1 hypothetical protein Tasa_045_009 [Tanticharoenia sakaeratensis NBRC 103193]GBQ25487.1 hypothetical protein AA103193_3102 [Tanticharoenia sakaeratensis NBRC 103193]
MIGAMPDDYAALHGTEDIAATVAGRQIAFRSLPDGKHAIVEDKYGSQQVWLRSDPSGRHDAYLLPHVGLEKHLGALLRFLDIPARGRFSLRHHLTRPTALRQNRLVLMLRVMRARAQGVSHREMGAVLFDRRARSMSALEWSVSDIRQSLYRLDLEGVAMVAGGYLELVRHGLSGKITVPEA